MLEVGGAVAQFTVLEINDKNSRSRKRVTTNTYTTQVVKCVSLEGEIESTTMVIGEGTSLTDHNHQISVMLENY